MNIPTKHTLLTLVLAVQCLLSYAQDNVLSRFADAITGTPLGGVILTDAHGTQVARGDSAGYVSLSLGFFEKGRYLVATCSGYKADTLFSMGATIYLQPIEVQMPVTIIRSSKVGRLLKDPQEYVVDYLFAGDNLLTATYSGNGGRNAKLFLLSGEGDILATCKVPSEPVGLFKSCVGNYYCVCNDVFYPIAVSPAGLSLKAPFKIGLLPGLMQCEQVIHGNHFYRAGDRVNFRMRYGMVAKDDTVFRPLVQFDEEGVARNSFLESEVANASYDEYNEMIREWESGHYSDANRRMLLRKLWDNGSYAHINIPLFNSGDSLVIFDYFRRRILFYDGSGRPIGQSQIGFEWKQSQQFHILKDEGADKFYIHRYGNKAQQTIEELDVHSGQVVSVRTPVGKPFAERVKISHGDIYFLYQNGKAGGTRQLYVQREGLSQLVEK